MTNPENTGKAILCMFSGGIDSAGVLHELLTNEKFKDFQLIIHHIHIINRENRAKAESIAVNKILGYYQQLKPDTFLYTESIFNTTGFAPLGSKRFPFDMDVCAFYAGNICAARKDVNQVAMGRTQSDVGSTDKSFMLRMGRAQNIFKSVISLERREPLPVYIFPVLEFTKKEIWEFLPEYVRSNTWWCRRPAYQNDIAVPCGKCETCNIVKEFSQ